ncbi:helix-turn-helix transcriptional regulator [Tenacibaculum piscium]|uniref:helix-turn-helix transcriptional regulator n=1 Tax=Tenacibaculum piscium TaxID=1458515 RepID=UPI001F488497|nr:helix-turn-helix transcriptional regulator [Tenacibaculum piscium]
MARRTKEQTERLKQLAQHLYLSDNQASQKQLSEKIGVTEKTISNWINDGNWEDRRLSLLTSKSNQLNRLYRQLDALTKSIENRANNFADSKEASTIINYTASIKNLETETSIGDIIQVAKDFVQFVAGSDYDHSKQITKLFDEFINSKIV